MYVELPKNGRMWKRPKAKTNPVAQASEIETLLFLHAITRMIKPDTVLELGTFEGDSAESIASALQENGRGKLYTIDIWDQGQKKRLRKLSKYVETIICYPCDVRKAAANTAPYNLVYIDDGHEVHDAYRDLNTANMFLEPNGYVLMHDANITMVQRGLDMFINEHQGLYEQIYIKSFDGVFILRKK